MKKIKFGKTRQMLRGKGFAIALVLSLTAVGASTYIAYDRALSKISLPDMDSIRSESGEIITFSRDEAAPVARNVQDILKDAAAPGNAEITDIAQIDAASPSPEVIAEEAGSFVTPKPPRVMPVEGEVYEPFSAGELRKSKTLGVWKTHDGIDITALLESPVVSMTNGTVSEVYSDPLWGICVVINHEDGVFGHYYGLDKNVLVSVGQKLNSGDLIGKVGNTAEIEIADPPHLHFGVKKNDVWIDPIEFIKSIR